MKIIILETGIPPAGLDQSHGTYEQMFTAMLAPLMPKANFSAVAVYDGAALPEPNPDTGYLISGSPAAVYEDHQWIKPLEAFTREAVAARRPVVGICFGHQLMAQAFGGVVKKSDQGWGVGVHQYHLRDAARAYLGTRPDITCAVSHRDQVVALPAGATRLAGSPFCPNGILVYDQGPALSLQMHPEFEHEFARALLTLRAGDIPAPRVAAARENLAGPSDRGVLAAFIAKFFERAVS